MSQDRGDSLTRRTALKSGAATAGLLAVGSLSGCSSIPFLGGASYGEWITDPSEYRDNEGLELDFDNPSIVGENEDSFDEEFIGGNETFSGYEERTDSAKLDIDYEDITFLLDAGPITVYDGEYNEEDVVDALEDSDNTEFDEEGEYEGYTVYLPTEPDNPTNAVGLNGTQIVDADASDTEEDEGEAILEMAIDTKNGDTARLTDENEDFSTLMGELSDGTFVQAEVREDARSEEINADSGRFEDEIAFGSVVTVNGDTSDFKYVTVWDGEGDTDEGALEDYADENLDEVLSPNDEPSINVSGRVGTIELSFDTDEIEIGTSLFI